MEMSNNILRIIFLAVVISVSFCQPAMAQSQLSRASDAAAVEVQDSVDECDRKPEVDRIDQTGHKVSQKIEAIGAKASDYLGNWIDSRVDAEISWVCLQLKIESLEKEYALSSGAQG